MYRRPKFLEVLLEIRQQMAREADYDVDLFAEMVRAGSFAEPIRRLSLTEPAPKGRKGRRTRSGD